MYRGYKTKKQAREEEEVDWEKEEDLVYFRDSDTSNEAAAVELSSHIEGSHMNNESAAIEEIHREGSHINTESPEVFVSAATED